MWRMPAGVSRRGCVCALAAFGVAAQGVPAPSTRTIPPPKRGATIPARPLDPAAFRLPDLMISDIRPTGAPKIRADGAMEAPVRFVVSNRGNAPAGPCKVSALASLRHERGWSRRWCPLTVARQADPSYGHVGELAPGQSRTLEGHVAVLPPLASAAVSLTLHVDSTTNEEFADERGRVRESDESNNASPPIRLAAELPPLPPSQRRAEPVQPGQPGRTSQSETWTFNVGRLTVVRPTESSGDEPYCITIGFRGVFSKPRSVHVWWNGRLNEVREDVGPGGIVDFPPHMGSTRFEKINRITRHEYERGTIPELLGVIVVFMESDGTPFSTVESLAKEMAGRLKRRLETFLGRARFDWGSPDEEVARMVEEFEGQMTPDFIDAIGLVLESGFDPDDYIGSATALFMAVEPDVADAMQRVPAFARLLEKAPRLRYITPYGWTLRGREDNWEWKTAGSMQAPFRVE